jgi:nucleoside-diphosphate-sugar epimerase
MRVLFVGGTGNISSSCSRVAVAAGIDLYHLNRGTSGVTPPDGVTTLKADINDRAAVETALSGHTFDAVVDWIAFTPDQIKRDIELFSGKTAQFVFISSASVYHKPVRSPIITESTPAHNPYWGYSHNKIKCERLLIDAYENDLFPITIIRPSHTYSDGWFPTTFGSRDFTVPQRMRDGKPIIVHGDGQSLWTLTHADDFAVGFTGLLGHPAAIGETFHITSDEAMTWDEIHRTIGRAIGAEPDIVHVPSEIIARFSPKVGPGLVGDKCYSVIFDNSKIKRYVPRYTAAITFAEGMRRSAAVAEKAKTLEIDAEADALMDQLAEAMRAVGP